ncbi:MAG: lipid II flippase MurJ, partial [Brevinematales bacterium]
SVGIYVSALSVVIGALGMVVLQYFDMRRVGYVFRPVWQRHSAEGKFWGLFWPTAVNMIALTGKNFLATWFLSFFVGGYVAYMNAFTVVSAPLGFIAIAVGTVMMPLLSRFREKGSGQEFSQAVEEGFLFLLYWTLPFMVYMVVLPETVNRVLFFDLFVALVGRSGSVTNELLILSHTVLRIFALSLLPMSAAVVFEKIFYATHDARTPLRSSLLTLFLCGGLYFLAFIPALGVKGVILAETISSYVVMVYYLVRIKRGLVERRVWKKVAGRGVFWLGLSVGLGWLGRLGYDWLEPMVGKGWLYIFLSGGLFVVFVVLYYLLTELFGVGFRQ